MAEGKKYRKGDETVNHRLGEDRYFTHEGHWFFTTREGVIMGPYDSRAQAIGEIRGYLAFVSRAAASVLNIIRSRKATISPEPRDF